VTDLDEAELARLIVLAERNVRNLVGTLGYFSPTIAITREGGANQRPTIVVAVDPGQATTIGTVAIDLRRRHRRVARPGAQAQRADIQRDWRLPTGQRFTQDAWDGAKTQALRDLVARRYPPASWPAAWPTSTRPNAARPSASSSTPARSTAWAPCRSPALSATTRCWCRAWRA
jgi:outer membrane translocation and assembly module TamA